MEQAITLFQRKIEALNKTEIKALAGILKKKKQMIVSSSAMLTGKEQKNLSLFLKKRLGECPILFQVQPDLILGIEAVIGDTVLEWNLKSYLDSFEGNLNAALAGLVVKE